MEMSFRVRVKRASRGEPQHSRGQPESLSGSRDATPGTELARWLFPAAAAPSLRSAPLPIVPSSRALGVRLDGRKLVTGRNSSERRDSGGDGNWTSGGWGHLSWCLWERIRARSRASW